jgi:hypothetical protein
MQGSDSTRRTNRLGARYPRQVAWVRVAIGSWLLCLIIAILYSSGRPSPWAWLLALGTVVHFGSSYRSFRVARQDPDPHMTLQR